MAVARPAGQYALTHRKNCSGRVRGTQQRAQGVDLASNSPVANLIEHLWEVLEQAVSNIQNPKTPPLISRHRRTPLEVLWPCLEVKAVLTIQGEPAQLKVGSFNVVAEQCVCCRFVFELSILCSCTCVTLQLLALFLRVSQFRSKFMWRSIKSYFLWKTLGKSPGKLLEFMI